MPYDECLCGCGEQLLPGNKSGYKRGHKGRKIRADWKAEKTATPEPEPEPELIETPPAAFSTSFDDLLSSDFPQDPEPDDSPAKTGRKVITRTPITPKVVKEVEAKTVFWLSLSTSALMPLDPVCLGVAQENVPNIARKLTPILCQSPEIVEWLTKAGNFALWADLGQALWPVVQIIIAHHVMKTVNRDGSPAQNGPPFDPNMFPA